MKWHSNNSEIKTNWLETLISGMNKCTQLVKGEHSLKYQWILKVFEQEEGLVDCLLPENFWEIVKKGSIIILLLP